MELSPRFERKTDQTGARWYAIGLAAIVLALVSSIASARPFQGQSPVISRSWEKFLHEVKHRKGTISEHDLRVLEHNFGTVEMDGSFSLSKEAPQPILIVRALNLLAGPSQSIKDVFFTGEQTEVTRTNSSMNATVVQVPAIVSPAVVPPLRVVPDRSATFSESKITSHYTPKQLRGLSTPELVVRAVDLAKTHGLLEAHGSVWNEIVDVFRHAHLDGPDRDRLRNAFHALATYAYIGTDDYIDRFTTLMETRNLTGLAKLIGSLAAITSRAEGTLPPHLKENGEAWSVEKYGVLSSTELFRLIRFSGNELASKAVVKPLQGDAWVGTYDARMIDPRLEQSFGTTGSQHSSEDPTRLVYGHIPPRAILEETMAATRGTQPNGVPFESDSLAVLILGEGTYALKRYKPTTQQSFSHSLANELESSLLGVHFLPFSPTPWFHLELHARAAEVWTHLRDGNPNAAATAIVDLASYLRKNPVTSAMMNLGVKAHVEQWNNNERLVLADGQKSRGVWLWSNKDPLRFARLQPASTSPLQPLEPALDDDAVRYLFLSPGEYKNLDTKKPLTIDSK